MALVRKFKGKQPLRKLQEAGRTSPRARVRARTAAKREFAEH